jgi:dihydrofolate reductase
MSLLSIIVAAAENGVIGSHNQLPWRLPDDLKRFKALTLGKPVVMGRRTFESIGKPLPGRTNIVVTHRSDLALAGCLVVGSLEAALAAAGNAPEIAVIGGAQIFEQALPRTDIIHLTRVHAHVDGDVHFPDLDPDEWQETETEHHPADDRHPHAFTFITLRRSKS